MSEKKNEETRKTQKKATDKLTYSRPGSTLQEAIEFTGKKQLLNIAPRSLKTLN